MAYCRAVIQIVSVRPGVSDARNAFVGTIANLGNGVSGGGGVDLLSWSTFSMQISRPTRMLWGPLTKPPGRSKRVSARRVPRLGGGRTASASPPPSSALLLVPSCPVPVIVVVVVKWRPGPRPPGRQARRASWPAWMRGAGTRNLEPTSAKIRALAPQYLILWFRCESTRNPRYPVIAAWGLSPLQDQSSGSQRGPGPRRGPCPPQALALPSFPPALGDPSAVSCQCQSQTQCRSTRETGCLTAL